MRLFFMLLFMSLATGLTAQISYYDEETSDWHSISPDTTPEIIAQFLAQQNATEIEFNTTPSAVESPLRVRNKQGNYLIKRHCNLTRLNFLT